MTVFSIFMSTYDACPTYTSFLSHFFSNSQDSVWKSPILNSSRCGRSVEFRQARVASSHSNPKILKRNRRTRHGHPLSTYDSEEDDDDDDDDGFCQEEDGDDCASDDEFGGIKLSAADRQRLRLQGKTNQRQGSERLLERSWSTRLSNSRQKLETRKQDAVARKSSDTLEKRDIDSSFGAGGSEKAGSAGKSRYLHLSEDLDIDERWFPLLDYLSTFGLKESHFIQMYERHMPSLQINADTAKERLDYLLSVGVKQRDIRRIILRQPQILEYTVENNLKSHVAFLNSLGIPESRIGHIITATPSLFSYSVENSLKPTIKYLLEEVGIRKNDLSKVVQLSPQILVQRIDSSWNTRLSFLTKELGAPRESIVRMVTKHPQILHYSIQDGLLPRINFLRSVGMSNSEILKVLTSLAQVFSLSLEGNLKPKYMYLINELRNEVHSLTKYPMYLSLSLDQRIRPRHQFLVALKKAPKGPFPLGSLVPTDECFCRQWAGTSVDRYLDFRQRLLLKELAKKYEKK